MEKWLVQPVQFYQTVNQAHLKWQENVSKAVEPLPYYRTSLHVLTQR